MLWIPFWAAGVVNGLAHWWGYRNGTTRDQSRNIAPWGIVIGGEELHNNHHLDPASPRLSLMPWEFDIGWMYIRILQSLKLATVKE
jgi:stearoyl-CoA desaturase (delta-9 desaturase)